MNFTDSFRLWVRQCRSNRFRLLLVAFFFIILLFLLGKRPNDRVSSSDLEDDMYYGTDGTDERAVKQLSHVLNHTILDVKTMTTDDFYAAQHQLRLSLTAEKETNSAYSLYFQRQADLGSVVDNTLSTETVARVAMPPKSALAELESGESGVRKHLQNIFGLEDLRWSTWELYAEPRSKSTVTPRYPWKKFFIAVNLYKNENIIPFFCEALVAFLEDEVAPFFSVRESVVVSIYSNDASDATGLLIKEFLIPRLQKAGVEVLYATISGSCLGHRKRQPFHNRIEWLSCVRNKALEPLYDMGMKAFLTDPLNPEEEEWKKLNDEDLVVIFFNDIFFKAVDITTLLETRPDPIVARHFEVDGTVTLRGTKFAPPTEAPPNVLGFDMACAMDYYYTLYDLWVLRDHRGSPLLSLPPYWDSIPAQAAVVNSAQMEEAAEIDRGTAASYGIPVKSCWNGVAAIRGKLFLPPRSTAVRRRVDTLSGRSSIPSPTNANVPIVVGSRGLYTSSTSNDPFEPFRARTVKPPAPLVIERPSGALLQRTTDITAEGIADYWLHTLAVRVGYRWGMEVRTANQQFCGLYPQHQLCRIGPEFLMFILLHANKCPAALDFAKAAKSSFYETWEQGSVYEELYPTLRLRSSVTPSYGAIVQQQHTVRSNVCQSSECLLICEDIAQEVYLQERRAAVILINPRVRVAYEVEHFRRIQSNAFLSPIVISLAIFVRRLVLWLNFFLGLDKDFSWRTQDGNVLQPREAVSIDDDWKWGNVIRDTDYIFSPVREQWIYVNLTRMTMLKCDVDEVFIQSRWYRASRIAYRIAGAFTSLFLFFVALRVFSRQRSVRRCTAKFREMFRASMRNIASGARTVRHTRPKDTAGML